ncbi:MAG: hypothetical protein AM325_007230 [Candidatus Thorarchaeota archaeon SMTZ1-45]|nr:MAG: hypothetical protein AM325_08960 [Candidatus Thorarchaeota archaeon SMTZ1-45]
MNRTLKVVLVISFVAIFLISPVAAATSEGLEWGVVLNDEFTYRFVWVDEGETTFDEGMNITVEATPGAIPDPLSDWTSIPTVDIDMYYTNGTALGIEALLFLGFIGIGGYFIVPTGNYNLLTELAMDSDWWTENHTIINDSSVWGVRLSGVDDGDPVSLYVQYLKSDGFCARYVLEATNSTSGVKTTVSLIRDGLGLDILGLLQDNILYVGLGVGVIVIIGAVVCMRRR